MSDTELGESRICNAYDSDDDEYIHSQEPCDISQFDANDEDYVNSDDDCDNVDESKLLILPFQLKHVEERCKQRYNDYGDARDRIMDTIDSSNAEEDFDALEKLFCEFQQQYIKVRSIVKLIHHFNDIYLETDRISDVEYDNFRTFVEEELPVEFYKDIHRDYNFVFGTYISFVQDQMAKKTQAPFQTTAAPKPKPRPIQYSRASGAAPAPVKKPAPTPAPALPKTLDHYISRYHTRIRYDVCAMNSIKNLPSISHGPYTSLADVVETVRNDDGCYRLCLAKQEKWFNRLVAALKKVETNIWLDDTEAFPHLSGQPLMTCAGVYRHWFFMDIVCVKTNNGFLLIVQVCTDTGFSWRLCAN